MIIRQFPTLTNARIDKNYAKIEKILNNKNKIKLNKTKKFEIEKFI